MVFTAGHAPSGPRSLLRQLRRIAGDIVFLVHDADCWYAVDILQSIKVRPTSVAAPEFEDAAA